MQRRRKHVVFAWNRDRPAIQAKLDELIRDELDEIQARCEAKARAESAADRAEENANRKAAQAAERATP